MPELIPISRIGLDAELQPRLATMPNVINDYARALQAGAQFPPVTAFDVVNKGLLLADGFHRLSAHRRIKRTEILAEVREGTWLEAFMFAREHNMRHGYRLNRAEVQNAIRDYLRHEDLQGMSDREIGRRLGVDHKTVAAQRLWLDTASDENSPPQAPARASVLPEERAEQTRALALIAAYRQALDALTEAESIERVQTEIGNWYRTATGGNVKWFPPRTRR